MNSKKQTNVKKRNGRLEALNIDKINKCVIRACKDLNDVSASEVVLDAEMQLFDGVTTQEIDKALILSARSKIEKEPNYKYVASRLLLNSLYKEVFKEGVDSDIFVLLYRKSFIQNIKKLVKENRLSKKLLEFDLKFLSENLITKNDLLFDYIGTQVLYDRYLLKSDDGKVAETPQAFFMRVAMGLAINEDNKNEKAVEFYNVLSSLRGMSSTPTLFNSGTNHMQCSSCFLNTFEDSIDGIFDGLWQEARKSKYAGGLGFDVTNFRASGASVRGNKNAGTGIVPWLRLFNDLLLGVNQEGKRPGAGCAYLETWHLDIEDFLELRKNTGDERRRTHDLNLANWIPDLFFKKLQNNEDWYLFSPNDVPELHSTFGKDFEKVYEDYCQKARDGKISLYKVINSKELWKKMLKCLFETGQGWMTFKDVSNVRYSNQHEGVVNSSNLCTEILLHTKPSKYKDGEKLEIGETAVCNLASVNLKRHLKEDGNLDLEELSKTVKTLIRMLDNVIDINFYPTLEAKQSNLRNRPIGLGCMGWHDIFHAKKISYSSEKAVELSDNIQEFISLHAIMTSSELAKERGKYETYENSLWSKNIFPIDTYRSYIQENRENLDSYNFNSKYKSDWDKVRNHVKEFGMRNSNTMAIAPTATISYISGCEQSIEPNYSLLFVYENKSGNFFVSNEWFVREMKELNLWTPQLINMIKSDDGDISAIDFIPKDIRERYRTAFQHDIFNLIKCTARRQKWIDQGISFNLYFDDSSLKKLNDIYLECWKNCLKTTYYLRTKSATKIEKVTVNKVEVKACSLDNPNCESCQ